MTDLEYDKASELLKNIHIAKVNLKMVKNDLDAINNSSVLSFNINKKLSFTRGGSYKVEHQLKLDIPIETVIKLLNTKLYVSENLLKKANYEFKKL